MIISCLGAKELGQNQHIERKLNINNVRFSEIRWITRYLKLGMLSEIKVFQKLKLLRDSDFS